MATLAAHIHAATYRLLTLIAELDRRGVWAEQGALTCAHWLGWACGIDAHTAREKVRVARALEELPLLSMAAARGEAGRCELEHHGALAAETLRRLCCDGAIVATIDGPKGEPLSVGRRTRSISPALRRALMSRDRGCRFPGCAATHRLHGHHVRHWAEGGETALDNLVLLCPVHHRLVHEGGFDVRRLDDGALRFTDPKGRAVRAPSPAEPPSPAAIVVRNEARGIAIDRETARARWHGEPIDYDHAIMMTMHAWREQDWPSGSSRIA